MDKAPEPHRGRDPADGEPASQVLRDLAADPRNSIPLGDLAAAAGPRVHALALLILALPDALPLPMPSVSAILAIPMIVISAHLVVNGRGPACRRGFAPCRRRVRFS